MPAPSETRARTGRIRWAPAPVTSFLTRVYHGSSELAASPRKAVILVGFASTVMAIAGQLTRAARQPDIPDELSYLLAAETFAAGRLTNPPHPMWKHFETEQVLVLPTYQSRYPPGQGLLLAAGKALAGSPKVGVLLGIGALGAALCWMLQPWVGRRAAFFGTLAFMPSIATSYWSFTYWGGTLGAFGGALVFGVLRRLDQKPRALLGVWLGIGVVVLANTRMYEGLLTSLPAAAYFLYWLVKRDPTRRLTQRAVVTVPLLVVLAAGGILTLRYNRAVTGDAWTTPYLLYARQYDRSPPFLWMPTRDTLLLREVGPDPTKGIELYRSGRAPIGFLRAFVRRTWEFGVFFVPVPLALAVLLRGRVAIRDRWTAAAAGIVAFVWLGMSVSLAFAPHYAAPLTGLVLAVLLASLQSLHRVPIQHPRWSRLASPRTLLWACVVLGLAKGLTYLIVRYDTDRTHWSAVRARFAAQLRETEGRHLVLVRYGRAHRWDYEWVYNAADIDRAAVVWAHDLGPGENERLFEHFRDRRVWRVEMTNDHGPFILVPLNVRGGPDG